MKKIIILLTISNFALGLNAQQIDTTWLRQYDEVNRTSRNHIVEFNADKFVVQHADKYYELNANGDSLNSGNLDTALGGIKSFGTDGTYFYAGGSKAAGPVISKLDTNYNILWTTALPKISNYGHSTEAVLTDSGFVFVSGTTADNNPFISKLDGLGNIVWHKSFPQSIFSNLTHLIKLNDGNYLASGNRDDYPLAFKFNSAGDTAWSYSENIFISFSYASAVEKPNGNAIMVMRNKIIEIDNMGNRVDSVHLSNEFGFNGLYIERKEDTLYLFGSRNGEAIVELRNLNLDSTNVWKYDWNNNAGAVSKFDRAICTSTGGLMACGTARDSVHQSPAKHQVLVARFNDGMPNTNTSIKESSKQLLPSQIYPNPANDKIYINLENVDTVLISDLMGNKISLKITNQYISTNTIPSGFYILQLKSGNENYHSKIIIRH